jgi:hypothetical protein
LGRAEEQAEAMHLTSPKPRFSDKHSNLPQQETENNKATNKKNQHKHAIQQQQTQLFNPPARVLHTCLLKEYFI